MSDRLQLRVVEWNTSMANYKGTQSESNGSAEEGTVSSLFKAQPSRIHRLRGEACSTHATQYT